MTKMALFLPVELYHEIALSIRQSDSEAWRTKSLHDWQRENKVLVTLSRVSKAWRAQTLPVLWDEILIMSPSGQFDIEDLQLRLWLLLNDLRNTEGGYGTHVKRLSIYLKHYVVPETLINDTSLLLEEMLEYFTGLQSLQLQITCQNVCLANPVVHLIHRLPFPSLKSASLQLFNCTTCEDDLLGQFFVNHPGIEDASIKLRSDRRRVVMKPDHGLKPDMLPNLRRYEGNLQHLARLHSLQHLTTIKCWNGRRKTPRVSSQTIFVAALSKLSNPFPSVTHLTFTNRDINLCFDTFQALARSFPVLEFIDGFEAGQNFTDFMDGILDDKRWYLPRMRTMVVHDFQADLFADLFRDENREICIPFNVESAIRKLPSLFESFVSLTYLMHDGFRGEGQVFGEFEMHRVAPDSDDFV
ncbi:hypothetical protein SISNIDRAFT_251386 [Sistotremastrum niveocremeum HHB9708]|uniref:F-box domain-containing protein n=1 Tax=Sistotremastrum niveocremeum HHB9708 TaxID=1314777 RepID=A0A164Z037_9AGAM|nr:hypothetical protein SISNIDRAFT_251386 [Sistotremastrum niveocremeum HHB9708]